MFADHYGHYVNGKDSVMEQVELQGWNDPNDAMGHSAPGDKVWVSRARDDDSNPTSRIPVSTVFATGNGGEFRKSFHSYPAPYAQLVESPSTWSIQPMQIDTKNRDGSMAKPGADHFGVFSVSLFSIDFGLSVGEKWHRHAVHARDVPDGGAGAALWPRRRVQWLAGVPVHRPHHHRARPQQRRTRGAGGGHVHRPG